METLTDIFIKSRYGRYEDNAKNRRLHRVGQEYGTKAKEEEGTEKQAKTEERTFGRAKKELAAVLANKDAFISKYGEAKFNEKVGQLIGEAQQLNGAEKQAKMDGDFEALKQDKRSKKEIRTERLGRYKASLEKVKESLKDTSLSPASRKAGEAMQAKLEEKITKLEARIGGKHKAKEPKPETNPKDGASVSADKLKNNFDSIVAEIKPFIDRAEVSKPVGDDESEIEAEFSVENWKDAVQRVGNGFYGFDDLLSLYTKAGNKIGVIQLRKVLSDGAGAAYQNRPVGSVIAEVEINNHWKDFDMATEAGRKAFADYLNANTGDAKDTEPVEKLVNELKEEAKKNPAKKSPARIVADTLQKIKDRFGYEKNWTDEKTEKLQDILIDNEEIVVSVMRAAFPSAASGSPMSPNTKEVDIDGRSFTFGAYSTMDTTTRNVTTRNGVTNHYFVKDDYGKTIAEYTSGGRWTTPADAKNNCKLYVLRTLLKF